MTLYRRFVCECGDRGEWSTSNFVARAAADVHRRETGCTGECGVQCKWQSDMTPNLRPPENGA